MTEPNDQEMTLRDYAAVIARRKWIVVLPVIAAVIGAIGLASLQDPIYEADAQMLVKTRAATTVFNNNTAQVGDPVRAIQNEIQVLEGEPVRQRVQADLGLASIPPRADGATVGSTDVVSVTVRSGDPTTARVLADAYVQAYIEVKREQSVEALVSAGTELQRKISELQGQIDTLDQQAAAAPESQQADLESQRRTLVDQQSLFKQRLDQLQVEAALATGGADVVRAADQPSEPSDPQPSRSAALALVVGLLIGLGAAFLLDYLDDSIRSPEDLERAADGLPVLAVVPSGPPADHWPIAMSRPGDPVVEAFRGLRTSLQFLGLDRATRVIHVTSPVPGDGKTTVASNLAVVFSQAGMRVLLVDADLRRPRVHKIFGVNASRGFTNVLIGEPLELLTFAINSNLDVLPAGPVPPNPSELLGGRQMRTFVEEATRAYDIVIFDSAPVLPVADSLALSAVADGVVLVTQAGRTSNQQVRDVISQLQRVQAPVLGTVLNRTKVRRSPGGYGYGYGYGQAYGRNEPLTERSSKRRAPKAIAASKAPPAPSPTFGPPALSNGHAHSDADDTPTSIPRPDDTPLSALDFGDPFER